MCCVSVPSADTLAIHDRKRKEAMPTALRARRTYESGGEQENEKKKKSNKGTHYGILKSEQSQNAIDAKELYTMHGISVWRGARSEL